MATAKQPKQSQQEIRQSLLDNKKQYRLKDLQYLCSLFGIQSHIDCKNRYQLCDMLSLYAISHPILWSRHKDSKCP